MIVLETDTEMRQTIFFL